MLILPAMPGRLRAAGEAGRAMLESTDESLVAVPTDHGGAASAGMPALDATLADLDDGATANAITSPNRAVPTGRRGRHSRRGHSQRARPHADPRRPHERGRGVRVLLALAAALAVIVVGANGAVDGLGLPLFPT